MAQDLQNWEKGTSHDELDWLDVQMHACQILNVTGRVVFVTSDQLLLGGSLITHAQEDGYRVVIIPFPLAAKLPTLQDIDGQQVRTLDVYRQEWSDSFQFTFISPDQLTPEELAIYSLTKPIKRLLTPHISTSVKEMLISETMRLNRYNNNEAVGVWKEEERRIVIKRSQLQSKALYAATLLHEYNHALSGADDVTLQFEQSLTWTLGILAERLVNRQRE